MISIKDMVSMQMWSNVSRPYFVMVNHCIRQQQARVIIETIVEMVILVVVVSTLSIDTKLYHIRVSGGEERVMMRVREHLLDVPSSSSYIMLMMCEDIWTKRGDIRLQRYKRYNR